MGRSVSTPTGAECVVYRDVSDIVSEFEWDEFIYEITMEAQELWPSLDTCDVWPGNREDHALLENTFIYFGVSEYCGMCAIWILVKEDTEHYHLARRWVQSVVKKFERVFGTGIVRTGVMSNGVAVYKDTKERLPSPFTERYTEIKRQRNQEE